MFYLESLESRKNFPLAIQYLKLMYQNISKKNIINNSKYQ